jgi:hypothetical protein
MIAAVRRRAPEARVEAVEAHVADPIVASLLDRFRDSRSLAAAGKTPQGAVSEP